MRKFDYPLLFEPIPVPKVWAGDKLAAIPGRKSIDETTHTGESWDVSTWPTAPDDSSLDTMSKITNGPLAGVPLGDVAQVPVVVKVIDSGQPLSVQCHPHTPDEHKNEMWYIFEANKDAYIYLGFADGVDADEFCSLLREDPQNGKSIMKSLNCRRNLERGTHFSVPAPSVHALGQGLLTFEISERSQVTYRLYDYDRARSRGHLDIDAGCEALTTTVSPQKPLDPKLDVRDVQETNVIAAFSTFCVIKATGDKIEIESAGHQHLLTASGGNCSISGANPQWNIDLRYTFSCLVPPTDKPYTIDTQGSGEVLISPLAG
ncbi:class I mannose-6-phosphate isomerase [bacterium]|nr:class I mannose-6-phosphate isomerase [bacterium]